MEAPVPLNVTEDPLQTFAEGVAVAPIVGIALIVKFPELVPVPAELVTVTFPVVPDEGMAEIEVEEIILKDCALTPPNFTDVTPPKFVTVIATLATVAHPLGGVNKVTVGPVTGGVNV